MLERTKRVTQRGRYTYIEYARFADDLVILVEGYRRWKWLAAAANRRLREELAKLDVQLNHDKTGRIDLTRGENFGFLGFDFRRTKTLRGGMGRALRAKDEGTDGVPTQTQGGLSTFSLPTDRSSHRPDQPGAARMG